MESKEAAENVKIKLWSTEIASAGHSIFKISFRTFKSD